MVLTTKSDKQGQQQIRDICQKAKRLGLNHEETVALFNRKRPGKSGDAANNSSNNDNNNSIKLLKAKLLFRKLQTYSNPFLPVLSKKQFLCCLIIGAVAWSFSSTTREELREMVQQSLDEPCVVSKPPYLSEVIRPHVPCQICKDLNEVPVVHNISKEDFARHYAYTGVPVLIKDAISDWGALRVFDYNFMKKTYLESKGSIKNVNENCQFFPYQTEFESFDEVFEMDDDRAALKEGTKPWYIGWSNCDANTDKAGKKLRAQYSRPYFIPQHSRNMDVDWLFMGGPGYGAGMHIDYVERPSWQAQISGTKTWRLEPSPECWRTCKAMEVTVEKGDIIVLDTNIWYHSTRVNPGNISITIGAEYD